MFDVHVYFHKFSCLKFPLWILCMNLIIKNDRHMKDTKVLYVSIFTKCFTERE